MAARRSRKAAPGFDRRLRWLGATLALLMVALLVGLVQVQIRRAAHYRALEVRQSLRRVPLPAPRGALFDRERRELAVSKQQAGAALHFGRLHNELRAEAATRVQAAPSAQTETSLAAPITDAVRAAVVRRQFERVSRLLGRQEVFDERRLRRHWSQQRAEPFVLIDELSPAEAQVLAAALAPDDPVEVHTRHVRVYPGAATAAHAIGRVRREMVETLPGEDFPILNYIDLVGDWGAEKQFDALLRGRPGAVTVRMDAEGLPTGPGWDEAPPEPGQNVVLSLDLTLQRAAERAMAASGATRGAAVALTVATGEVLVMASSPNFDLNAVSPSMSVATKARLDATGAWLNRATQALYPPGSSFKPYTMLAGLRTGTLRPADVVYCPGYYDVGPRRFRCHNADGHGPVQLRTALAVSCNVFAYTTGLAAGPVALAAEARRFHVHEPTGLDLPAETTRMLVPDPEWKAVSGRGDWTVGDTANLAIGQAYLRISPLQAACAMASLARRETLTVPTLLWSPGRRPSGAHAAEPLGLAEADYEALRRALQAVVATGIGRDAQVPGVTIAGKTGTAQLEGEDGMMNVAWFVAFAPVERPEIAVAVALEGDEPDVEFAGARYAAPVVREIIAQFFDRSGVD